MTNVTGSSTVGTTRSFISSERCAAMKHFVFSVALAALAGVAAYYSFAHGLNGLMQRTYTRVDFVQYGYGMLIYIGVGFGLAAVANTIFSITSPPCDAETQVAGTLGAPLAAVGCCIYIFLQGK